MSGEQPRRRFRFLSSSRLLDSIEVVANVEVEQTLRNEAGCYTAQALQDWQELCCASEFNHFVREVQGSCQTLPQVILQQDVLIRSVLVRLRGKFCTSSPAFLGILKAIAHDLGSDFSTHFHTVTQALVHMIDEGAKDDAEALDAIFSCLSYMCKICRKLFVEKPTQLLSISSSMRTHPNINVRRLTAAVVGFTLRSTPLSMWTTIYTELVADARSSTSSASQQEEFAEGIGELLYHCVSGAAHELQADAFDRLRCVLSHALSCTIQNEHIHAVVVTICLRRVLKHTFSGATFQAVGTLLHKALEGELANTSELVALAILTLSVKFFRAPEETDRHVDTFNLLLTFHERASIVSVTTLRARQQFVLEVAELVLASESHARYQIPSLHKINWEGLVCQREADATFTFLHSLHELFCKFDRVLDGTVVASALVAAHQALSVLAERSVQLVRKIILKLNSSTPADSSTYEHSCSTMSASKMEMDFGAANLHKSVLDIYYLPLTKQRKWVFQITSHTLQDACAVLLQGDVLQIQDTLSVVTACLESAFIMKSSTSGTCEDDDICVHRMIECMLGATEVLITCPSAWSSWVSFCDVFSEYFHRYAVLLRSRLIDPAIQSLDSANIDIRRSCVSLLNVVAAGRLALYYSGPEGNENVHLTNPLVNLKSELRLFCMIHGRTEMQGNILVHMKHCSSELSKLSRQAVTMAKSDLERLVLVKCCLGTLHVRLATLWPAIYNYLHCLETPLSLVRKLVIEKLIKTQRLCLGDADNGEKDLRTEHCYCMLDGESHLRTELHWAYLQNLLNYLVSGEKIMISRSDVGEYFLQYVNTLSARNELPRKLYDSCLVAWLQVLSLTGGAYVNDDRIVEALHACLIHDSTNVANEALSCMENLESSKLTKDTIEYLRLLLNERTFKSTLTTRRISFDLDDDATRTFYVSDEERCHISPLLVQVLQRHAQKNDKRGISSAALGALSIFETEEILPVFIKCLVDVVNFSEVELRDLLLDSLLSRRNLGGWLRLQFLVTGSSKSRLTFLRNLTGFILRLHIHLGRCSDLFFLIVLKMFTSSLEKIEDDIAYGLTDEGFTIEKGARTVYRASVNAIVSLFEHFHERAQCYWHIISPSIIRSSERMHLQVSSGVPMCLKITEVIVAKPDALFAESNNVIFVQDVSNIIRRSWSCLELPTISLECRICIMTMLKTITEYAEMPHSRFRVRAQALLREEHQLLFTVLNKMHVSDVRWNRLHSEDDVLLLERLALLIRVDDAIVPDIISGIVHNIVDSRRVDGTRTKRLLSILERIMQSHRVDPDVCVELLPKLLFVLDSLRSSSVRLKLIRLFQLSAVKYPAVAELVSQLEDMHAMRTDKIDEPDYLIRLKSYGQLTSEFFMRDTLEVFALEAILRQCIFDLKCEELAVRLASRTALANFAMAMARESTASSNSCMLAVTHTVIEKSIPVLLAHRDHHLRVEGINLLKTFWDKISMKFADLNQSKSLQVKSILDDACNIQIRHQSAALRELKQLLISCAIPEDIIKAHFLPLLKGFLRSSSPDVTETALSTIVETIQFMSWHDYVQDLKKSLNSRRAKSIVSQRYACALLINIDRVGASASNAEAHLSRLEAITILSKHIPSLEASMIDKSPENIGVVDLTISHALCKLVLLLDSSEREEKLQIMVSKLADAFCSRSQKIRDSAQRTFLCIIKAVPSKNAAHILQYLTARMDKGFVRYVRAATISACMEADVLMDDDFAFALPALVKIIEHDIFGDLYDRERCSAAREFCRECRKNYPLQSVFHIFRRACDELTMNIAMRPIKNLLTDEVAPSTQRVRKLQAFFESLRNGLNANKHIQPQDVCTLFFSVFSHCVKTGRGNNPDNSSKGFQRKGLSRAHVEVVNSLAILSLSIIGDALKQISTTGQRISHQSVESMFFVLLTTLPQHGELQVGVLGVMKLLLHHSPILFRDHFVTLTKNILFMLKSSSSRTLRNSSYDLLSKVLKAHHLLLLTEEFCSTVTAFTLEDVSKGDVSQANFAILRVIIGRRFITPQLYEVVERLMFLNATGSSAQLRESCSKLIVQFMLTYPLGERKVLALFDALLPNADYEYSQGRLSILMTITALMEKLPEQILGRQSESLLLVLLTKLASEEDDTCRSLCLRSIATLIRRASSNHRDILLRMIGTAVVDESSLLAVAALQVLTKTIPEIDAAVQTYIQLQSEVMNKVITLADSKAVTEVKWFLLYNYLALFEQALEHNVEHDVSRDVELKLCLSSVNLLRHDHIWVRTITCRVVYMFAFRSQTLPSTVHRRTANFHSIIEDMFHAIIDVLKRFKLWGTSKDMSEKTMFSILQTLVRVSAVLLVGTRKRRTQEDNNFTQPASQHRFQNAITKQMYNMRASSEPSLQHFSLRWTAALVFELADQLEQHFEVVCDLITLCQYRDRVTEELIRISDDILQCLSRNVPNQMWMRALTAAESQRKHVSSKRKRCPI